MNRSNNMRVSWRSAVSALADHVIHVVLICAEKQMVRIAARRHVANMANKHACWYGPIKVAISYSMSPVVWRASGTRADNSISSFIGCAQKYPASRKRDANNFIKNSCNCWLHIYLPMPIRLRSLRDMPSIHTLLTRRFFLSSYLRLLALTSDFGFLACLPSPKAKTARG